MISLLRLHNFKCFKDQDVSLKPLTLLTGLNSTGKSSVIQSLLLLRQSYQEQPQSSAGLVLGGNLVNLGVGEDVFFENAEDKEMSIGVHLQIGHKTEIAQWRFKHDRDENDDSSLSENAHSNVLLPIDTPSILHEWVYNSSLFNRQFHYLSAERVGPRHFFDVSDFQVRRRRQLGSKGEYTVHFLSVFGDDEISDPHLAHSDAQSSKLKDQVVAWLREISPRTLISLTSHTSVDIVELRYAYEMGKSLTDNKLSKDHRAANVGFGLTYVLPILTAILSSAPGALLLIENPEAHLHPKGQSRMGELLARAASCGIQIIVETHSDHILNGIRLAVRNRKLASSDVQIHFFQRGEHDGVIDVSTLRVDRNGSIDEWPDGFFDQSERDLMALWEPRDD